MGRGHGHDGGRRAQRDAGLRRPFPLVGAGLLPGPALGRAGGAPAAQAADGSAVADLLAGTTFDAFTAPDAAGRVQIAGFAPDDADGESCRLWLVDERELWEAAAAMAGRGPSA